MQAQNKKLVSDVYETCASASYTIEAIIIFEKPMLRHFVSTLKAA